MHELSLAMEVVDRALCHAEGARIQRICLQVGVLSCVLPEALQFCFDVVAEGTQAAGAELSIQSTLASVRCKDCDRRFELSEPLGTCSCGSSNLEWVSGRELDIVAIHLEVQ